MVVWPAPRKRHAKSAMTASNDIMPPRTRTRPGGRLFKPIFIYSIPSPGFQPAPSERRIPASRDFCIAGI